MDELFKIVASTLSGAAVAFFVARHSNRSKAEVDRVAALRTTYADLYTSVTLLNHRCHSITTIGSSLLGFAVCLPAIEGEQTALLALLDRVLNSSSRAVLLCKDAAKRDEIHSLSLLSEAVVDEVRSLVHMMTVVVRANAEVARASESLARLEADGVGDTVEARLDLAFTQTRQSEVVEQYGINADDSQLTLSVRRISSSCVDLTAASHRFLAGSAKVLG